MAGVCRVRAFGFLLLVCACGSKDTRLVLTLPPATEGKQALLLLLDAQAGTELFAYDLASDETVIEWPTPIDPVESARIWSFAYERSLSSLSIAPGAVDFVEDGRPIPTADAEHVAKLDADAPVWEARPRTPEIEALEIEDAQPYCAQFELRRIDDRNIETGLSTALQVAPRVVAVATGSSVYLVEAEVARPAETWAAGAPTQMMTAIDERHAWFGGDNVVWTATHTVDGVMGMRFGERIQGPTGLDRGVLRIEGVPEALFVLQDSHELRLWDGSDWSVVYTFPPGGDNSASGLISPSPGEAWAVHPAENHVAIYDKGELRTEELPTGAGLSALALLEGTGPIAGSARGEVFVRRGSAWESLGDTQLSGRIRAFYPLADGFIAAGDFGLAVQYVASRGRYCPPVSFGTAGIRWLVPYDEGQLLAGGSRSDSDMETPVTIVTPSSGL